MSNETDPILIIIAGPNGAGKSTFYQTILKQHPSFQNIDYINWDDKYKDITQNSSLNENKNELMEKSGRIVVENINKNIQNKKSFIYETTSSGNSHLNIIRAARKQNFQIMTIFIGLSSVNLSILRVKERVENGGHDIPKSDIIRRYPKIIKHFPEFLNISDTFLILDNSGIQPFKLIFVKTNDFNRAFSKFPQYINNSLTDYGLGPDVISITNDNFKKLTPEQHNILINNILSKIKL